ncbi:hypothetical protein [Streptomyces sp. MBT33]|uniref:hypothetical protein n=1 Tax=Streptomyces sp. MBT33 TaxID=1488363 RepID=UPI00190B7FE6|nr:hypothetical protein [Streptomyces sp. MBT33]MBK3639522.1 hypothetical protein [Streptomyces sp. MBT33]
MTELTDHDVRARLRAHQDGGPISRLFETGEIVEETFVALGMRADQCEAEGQAEEAEQVTDVVEYVSTVGERPPVPNWPTR